MIEKVKILLLVEDDDNDIIISKRKLARSTVPITEILVTKTLAETAKLLTTVNPDLIVLDLNLPDSRGIDTLSSLLNMYKGIVIVLTSLDDMDIGIESIRRGADDFLVKTELDEKELGRAIYFAIERRRVKEAQARIACNLEKLDTLVKATSEDK